MTTQTTTVAGVAASTALCADTNNAAANNAVYVKVGAGSTVTVQVTPDDPAGTAPNWFATGIAGITAITADALAQIPFPFRAVRLNQTAAGAASQLQLVSAGSI